MDKKYVILTDGLTLERLSCCLYKLTDSTGGSVYIDETEIVQLVRTLADFVEGRETAGDTQPL